VFEYQGEELLRGFPRLKRSVLNWSLWLLARDGLIGKIKARVNSKLSTLYGCHDAISSLKEKLTAEKDDLMPSAEPA